MTKKQTEEIILNLPKIISNGPNHETINILDDLGLNKIEINEVLDIINQGIGRAGLYKMGMKSEQFSSYLNEDPIFLKTIDLVINSEIDYKTNTDDLHPELKKAFIVKSDEKVDFDQLLFKFNDSNNRNRSDALYDLINNGYPKVTAIIESALFDPDMMVQIISIQGISEDILTTNLEKKLIELFNKTKHHTIVSNLCHVFSNFQIKNAIHPIINKMKSEENLMSIYNCILCLGNIGDKNIIDDLAPFKNIRKIPEIYDEDGLLEQTTQFSIREITKKTIKKLKLQK